MPPEKKMKTALGKYDVIFEKYVREGFWKDYSKPYKPRHIRLWEKKLAERAKG